MLSTCCRRPRQEAVTVMHAHIVPCKLLEPSPACTQGHDGRAFWWQQLRMHDLRAARALRGMTNA